MPQRNEVKQTLPEQKITAIARAMWAVTANITKRRTWQGRDNVEKPLCQPGRLLVYHISVKISV